MTTVAYRNGVMVADRMLTRGDEAAVGGSKMFRTKEFIVGLSGCFTNLLPLKSFLEEHEKPGMSPDELWAVWEDSPSFGEGYCAIIVTKNGDIYSSSDGPPIRLYAAFESIGSGAAYAMGAMAAGAHAEQAVCISARYDIATGRDVEAMFLIEDERHAANG